MPPLNEASEAVEAPETEAPAAPDIMAPELTAQAEAVLAGSQDTPPDDSQSPDQAAEDNPVETADSPEGETAETAEVEEAPEAEAQEDENGTGAELDTKVFREIDPDSIESDEAKQVYDLAAKAVKNIEADWTQKSQASAAAVKAIDANRDALTALAKAAGDPRANLDNVVAAAVEHLVRSNTDKDYAKQVYDQLGKVFAGEESATAEGEQSGQEAGEGEETPGAESEVLNQLRAELDGLKSELKQRDNQALATNLQKKEADLKASDDFKHFTDKDWDSVWKSWEGSAGDDVVADLEAAARGHAELIAAHVKAQADKQAQELVEKKSSAAPAGAGGSGAPANPAATEANSIEEATQRLLSQL